LTTPRRRWLRYGGARATCFGTNRDAPCASGLGGDRNVYAEVNGDEMVAEDGASRWPLAGDALSSMREKEEDVVFSRQVGPTYR
jgi:hypothetical protein